MLLVDLIINTSSFIIISLLCPGMHSDAPHRHVACWAVGEQSVTHQASKIIAAESALEDFIPQTFLLQ